MHDFPAASRRGDHAFLRPQLIALAAAAMCAAASAQEAAKPAAPAPEVRELEAVVVTGTARREGVRKLEAGFSITTATEEQIKQAAPASTADLLKTVPGIFVETSGGQAGANIRVRGFPTPGDGPYSTFQLNGAPLYHLPTLSFFEHSQLFRLDDTIDRMEVLRGGPSPVFGSGQPGVTVNFIQKDGRNPEAGLRVTTGTGDLRRVDGVYAGKLSDQWNVMVGGFWRQSHGLRDTQFPADDGGQASLVLTRKLDSGSLQLYARALRDRNAFFTAIPVVGGADGKSVSSYPGFDASKDYFYGNELRRIVLETGRATGRTLPNGRPEILRETVTRDLAEGRGADVQTYGANLDTKLGDWTLTNKLSHTRGDTPTYALFSGANPQTLSSYIASQVTAANAEAAVVAAAGGVATTGTATFTNGGGSVAGTTPVIVNGMWVVDKALRSTSNETRLSREVLPGHNLTVGLYLAGYSSHDVWTLGQAQLMTVQPHARLIDVRLDNGVRASRAGHVSPPFSFNLDADYSGDTHAFFIADEWQVTPQLRIDLGARRETQRITGSIANVSNGDLDADPTTLYNNSLSYFSGTSTLIDSKLSRSSFTAGANYAFSREFSAFVRANKGHRLPDFDVLRGRGANETRDSVEDITQFEIGLKTSTKLYSAFLTAYQNRLTNSQTQQFTNAGNVVLRPNSKATGLEFELALRPGAGFEIAATGNFQDAKYRDFQQFTGNRVERAPKFQARLTPSWQTQTGFGQLRAFATLSHVGERFADQTNTLKLPAYRTVDAGAVFSMDNGLEVRLTGTNLTNKIGLTEGNFRVPGQGVGQDGVFLARPLFGRAYELSVGFQF
ncbi:TonB-dependent receptor domain-containing protein [Roseateles asaccharophilus]|uniref:Outer membrane receptor protein involved in Fe transport n=1 Tax=Roseateles asaccharophilus TaxID=582607 RepID=A0ABU2A3V8_9BURK|nr:TonB-dependent receptor [Roseateles asaccharophilus]MDR7331871.1 outer membrane receptor protein involved in Fe transport [Roseateles asaccharophilus]